MYGIYMDDLIIGNHLHVWQFQEAKLVFESTAFQLHKIHSNISNEFGSTVHAADNQETTTILGLKWNKNLDQISIRKVSLQGWLQKPRPVNTHFYDLVRNDDNVEMKFHNSDNAQLILKGLDTIPSIIYQRKSDKPAIKYVVMGLAPDKLVCN